MDSLETKPVERSVFDRILEACAAILLSAASVAMAWSGYQAALWDGQQAKLYAQAAATRQESGRTASAAGAMKNIDVNMFMQWLNARMEKKHVQEAFYRARFRPEFRPAFEAWLASDPEHNPDALPHPFVHPLYKSSLQEKAEEIDERAEETFKTGQNANWISDNYVFNTVILSAIMFFSGIAHQFPSRWVQLMLLSAAIAAAVMVGANLCMYPVTHPG